MTQHATNMADGAVAVSEPADAQPRGSGPLRIMFIRNPKAGLGTKGFTKLVNRHVSPQAAVCEIVWTKAKGDAETIARRAADEGYDIVVAVGGDGTVNEVGRGLLHAKSTSLAIIPTGSGNGFARHLGIPLSIAGALQRLNNPSFQRIDVGRINGHAFLCTAGLGFDAHISERFSASKRRGLLTYIKLALEEYAAYRAKPIELNFNGAALSSNCYVLAFANAGQYGNNVYIAPLADVSDGLLDLCLIEELPIRRAVRVAVGLAVGDLPKSRAAIYHRASQIQVDSLEPIGFHADGEYLGACSRFEIGISPLAISVCV